MNRRLDRLRRVQPDHDVTAPPPGVRLVFGSVASRLRVTITEMADAAAISRTAVADAVMNIWPTRRAVPELQQAIAALLAERGATDDELATLWHSWRHSTSHANAQPTRGRAATPPPTLQPPTTEQDLDMLMPKQALSPQARRHFKLFVNPFDGEVTTDEQMFSGADFAYVREAAWQCSQTGGFVALTGESGAGKTTVLNDLEARLQREARGVILIKPGVLGMEETDTRGKTMKSADILHAVITTLDASKPVPQTLQARTVRAHKLLAASAQAGAQHLLVVEEAHSMPDATLKHLKRLHELRDGRRPLLGILLLAQPELKLRLAAGLRSGTLREVSQRCEVVELLPLDSDLKPYLERRAQAAGQQLAELMDDAAIEHVRSRLTRKQGASAVSMCYPLAVNNLVTRCLNHA
ncbi:MAG TPA: AAA family ATPase, partial [Rubrivivax sp.]|nr:AAA family ATPase [Rubrivivax sp.]